MTVQQRPTWFGRKNTFWMSVYCKEYMPMFAILLLLVNRKQSAPFNMNMSVVDVIQMLTVAQSLWSASKWLQPFEMYDARGGLLGFTLHINNVAAWTKSWTTYRISHGKSGNSHGQGQCLVLPTWGRSDQWGYRVFPAVIITFARCKVLKRFRMTVLYLCAVVTCALLCRHQRFGETYWCHLQDCNCRL
jgi:hypothetical protein